MKIYNISDTSKLFDTLSKCDGRIDLVRQDGTHIALNDPSESSRLPLVADSLQRNPIHELEFSFANPADAARICQFLVAMRNVA